MPPQTIIQTDLIMISPIHLLLTLIMTTDEPGPLRIDLTRDAWVSGIGSESDGNNGAAPRLKLKSHQEFSLIDIPAETLRSGLQGRVLRSVTLRVKSSGEPRLKRVSVGGTYSFREGKGQGYEPLNGASTFRRMSHPDLTWPREGDHFDARRGDISDVLFGPQGAVWGTADASAPDAEGWQLIPVEPRVFAARVAGLVGAFVVFDDTGTEWVRRGESYQRTLFPNRFLYSRDQNSASAPHFLVEFGPEDHQPPLIVGDLRIDQSPDEMPAGEVLVSWTTPEDEGPAGTLGFLVNDDIVPERRYRIPIAGKPGDRVQFRLRRQDFQDPSRPPFLSIRAIDAAGNIGEAAKLPVVFSDRVALPLPPEVVLREEKPGPLPRLGHAEVAIIDELDKVHPTSGIMIPAQDQGYLARNHLWNASARSITLHAARGEAVTFQILLKGAVPPITPSLEFASPELADVAFGTYTTVPSARGPLPDPIVRFLRASHASPPDATSSSLHVELQVRPHAKQGDHRGQLRLKTETGELTLTVDLRIWNFSLPDRLSFLPEMNCYGLPENELAYYRLAHRHRTYLNRVPYSQRGEVSPGCAPAWDGKTLDWTEWDRRFGPLFEGSAFAGLPRSGVPIEGFFLPLHENWPTPIDPHYDGGYWSDRAISATHRRAFVEASRQIADHVRSKGWDATNFQCFFNGKNDFKDRGWSRGSSPWLLDEPANFQDFWALRDFGQSFHEGINLARPGKSRLMFRADISRPQWQRDLLDDVLDFNVVGSAFREYRPMVLERKHRLGQVVIEYGSTNPIEASNVQAAAWSLDVWTLGGDGVLPWQTVGSEESRTKADELSLFYPARDGGDPVPSIRLKAYRRGQQDVEYLELYARASGQPRWAVAESVRGVLKLEGVRKATGSAGEDAGRVDYNSISPRDLWALRVRMGKAVSDSAPQAQSQLKDWTTPKRHPQPMRDRVVLPQ